MNQKKLFKISIVTPSLNQGKYIEDCIQSVLNQNYPNFEHIIIDGGSNDGTIDILKKYPHLKWISEPDEGQSDAINKGFKLANGDIIAWLNSDDVYCRNVFSKINNYFTNNKKSMWVCGNVLFTDRNLNIYSRKKPFYSKFLLHFASSSVYQPNNFFRIKILDEIGYLKNNFHAIMDREWFSRISNKYEPHLINLDIAKFRWHDTNKSVSGKNSQHYKRYISESIIVANYHNNLILKYILKLIPQFTMISLANISRVLKLLVRFKRIFKPLKEIS